MRGRRSQPDPDGEIDERYWAQAAADRAAADAAAQNGDEPGGPSRFLTFERTLI